MGQWQFTFVNKVEMMEHFKNGAITVYFVNKEAMMGQFYNGMMIVYYGYR